MKKPVLIIGSIVVALLLMAASFYGGTLYQSSKANSVRNSFLASRGLNGGPGGGGFGGGGAGGAGFTLNGTPGAGRGGFGGGINGTVKSIDGNTLTISTAQDVTTVTLSDSTTILKNAPATIADLKVGDRVTVAGQRDSNGNITTPSQVMDLGQFTGGGPGTGAGRPGATPTP